MILYLAVVAHIRVTSMLQLLLLCKVLELVRNSSEIEREREIKNHPSQSCFRCNN